MEKRWRKKFKKNSAVFGKTVEKKKLNFFSAVHTCTIVLLASASSNGLRLDFVGPKVVLVNTLKEGMPR